MPEGEVGSAVERVIEDHDRMFVGEGACDLDRVFDGFGTGVEQCCAFLVVTGGDRVEFLGDRNVAVVWSDGEAGVGEQFRLASYGFDNGWS